MRACCALVLAELAERGYRLDAMRYSRDRHDIWAIVSACLGQPGALAALAEVLHGIEGEHLAVTEFRRLASPPRRDPRVTSPWPVPGPAAPHADEHLGEPDLLIRAITPEYGEYASGLPHVAREQLTPGAQLGAGARGRVFALAGQPGLVYKEYLSEHVNGGALAELILQRSMLDAADRKLLDAGTSWPLMRVMASRHIVGCLMRALPDEFYIAADAGRRPAYLSYLCYPPKPASRRLRRSPASEVEAQC